MDDITIIKPRKGLIGVDFKELFRYRELAWVLALKEIKVRYKQTVIGGAWAIIQPFSMMVIFTIFFGGLLKVPSDDVPYPIFSYSGLLLWTYFTTSLTQSSMSLVGNMQLVKKIYFPRILIPTSATLVGIVDYIIASIILLGLMIYYNFIPSAWMLLIPFIVFFTWMLASGIGFWLSSIMVKYRDVRYIVPFFTGLFIYITPVIYPVSIAGNYKWLLMLNPMTGFIEAHRAMILGHQAIDFGMIGVSVLITLVIFISGLMYFKSVERYFDDII